MGIPTLPPVVYAGPSISPGKIAALLPDAQVMPPISRGDLYRDRMLGFSWFIVLDGVFLQSLAIPPREILDVLADGARVIGASSMGAIRAAECWPAGMIGIGSIYRLYRRGALRSDDDVAVAFNPELPSRLATVPLVNVRYSLRQALKRSWLQPAAADAILEAALRMPYHERTWKTILASTRLDPEPPGMLERLERFDLKGLDAERALRHSARILERDPRLLWRPRATPAPFVPNEAEREAPADPYGGAAANFDWAGFWAWLIASGQENRFHQLKNLDVDTLQDRGRRVLEELGELDPLVFRFRAIRKAVQSARDRELQPAPAHRHGAEMELALAHGFPDWVTLQRNQERLRATWDSIERCREELTLAKCVRERLFEPGGDAG